jgi:hypothetical protein
MLCPNCPKCPGGGSGCERPAMVAALYEPPPRSNCSTAQSCGQSETLARRRLEVTLLEGSPDGGGCTGGGAAAAR